LHDNTTGYSNTAAGYGSAANNTTGYQNTALGHSALAANTTGAANTAVGYRALQDNTTGANNTAAGFEALSSNTTGTYNTAFGRNSLNVNTTGIHNVACGYGALRDGATGNYNTAVGMYAAYTISSGTYNTCIGYLARPSSGSNTQTIAIGNNVAGASNYTTIGNGGSDIRAAHGVATWSTVSDERFKKDITDSTAGLDFVNALRPRTWNYRTLGDLPENFDAYEEGSTEIFKNTQTNHGFIAQEVKAAIDAESGLKDGFRLWDDRDDGSQEVAEAALIPVLVKAIQDLSTQNEALEARLLILEGI